MPDITLFDENGNVSITFTGERNVEVVSANPGLTMKSGIYNEETDCLNGSNITQKITQTTSLSKTDMLADGIDIVNILNAPIGASIEIKLISVSPPEVVFSGTINGSDNFITNVAGTYKVSIQKPMHKTWNEYINAN